MDLPLLKSRLARLLPCITQKPLKWLQTQIPVTVPAARRQRAHAACLEQRDLHTLRPPSSSFSSPVHSLLQDPSWRRSVNFLPPARAIFFFALKWENILFSAPALTRKQTLRELGRHFEYFLCEHSVPGHFLPQGTVYLMWGRPLQQERSKAFVLLPDEQKAADLAHGLYQFRHTKWYQYSWITNVGLHPKYKSFVMFWKLNNTSLDIPVIQANDC